MKTLEDRLRWTLENKFDGVETKWSAAAGSAPGHLWLMLNTRLDATREGRIHLETIERFARAASISPAWLAFGIGGPEEPSAGTFLLKLEGRGRIPGLLDTIMAHPERWRATTLVRATSTVFESDSDGLPMGGWEKALDSLERGNASGNATEATNLVLAKVKRRPKLPPGA